MSQLLPYKQLNRLLEKEAFEPLLSWGFRMAIAAIIPIIWGVATGHMEEASWVALTAEAICWIELKGAYAQRMRVIAGGTILALLFGALGSATGGNIWLSVICMAAVGFLSGLFKNLGDRGSGLANCVFIVFIITNAYPTHTLPELGNRLALVLEGGVWSALVSSAAALFMPAQQPYRRSVALIWRSIADLIQSVSIGWDGNNTRSNLREIYLQEKAVRTAIDNSIHFHETMAHQAAEKNKNEYELAQLRKATALVAAHIIGISQELESLSIKDTDSVLRLKLYAMLKTLQQTVDRMAIMVVSLKPEDELLLTSRINRTSNLITLLKEYPLEGNTARTDSIRRIIVLSERSLKLIQSSVERLEKIGKDLPVFRSYSLLKTIFILHPKHLVRNTQLLFNFNTFTTRYAVRAAVAGMVAMFINKWFAIDHGYWIPFTVIIVLQPYFGATITKAIDRVLGTILGGIAGGILLRLPAGLYLKEFMLFVCFILMVYYVRRRYSIAVFFITLSVVLLFDFEENLNPMLIFIRAASTAGGAVLAIVTGFALLPHWDRKWLPVYLANAVCSNYQYFLQTFYNEQVGSSWTKHKRNAESKNSNAFDSFNRFIQEPGTGKKTYSVYYHIITHNVRVTRELNNIHLEEEGVSKDPVPVVEYSMEKQQQLIAHAHEWFNKNIALVQKIDAQNKMPIHEPLYAGLNLLPLSAQQILYIERMTIELRSMHQDMLRLTQLRERREHS